MKIAVFGLGYVGTVTAACLAARRPRGRGCRRRPHQGRVIIAPGRSPVVEPGLDELVATPAASGRLHATTEFGRGAATAPTCRWSASARRRRRAASTDLSYIERAVAEIGVAPAHAPVATSCAPSCVRSTVPPGTVDGSCATPLARESGRRPASTSRVAMCPEFLREGSSVDGLLRPAVHRHRYRTTSRPSTVLSRAVRLPPGRVNVVSRQHGRGAEVRVQRLPRRRRCRSPTRSAGCTRSLGVDAREVMELFVRGPGAQHLAGLPAARVRLRRVVPAQGPARRCCTWPGSTASTCRCWPARWPPTTSSSATWWTGCVASMGPRKRRAARPELQAAHRRPAREPERRAGRAAHRQGLRRADLRPDRQPEPGSSARTCAYVRARSCRTCRRLLADDAGRRRWTAPTWPAVVAPCRGDVGRWSPPAALLLDLVGSARRRGRALPGLRWHLGSLTSDGPAPWLPSGTPRWRAACSSSCRTCRCPSTGGSGWSARRCARRLRGVGHLPEGPGRPVVRRCSTASSIYKYRPYAARRQHGSASSPSTSTRSLATAWLAKRARRPDGFDVIQACNPPDIFWPLGPGLPRARTDPVRVRPPRPVPRAVSSPGSPSGPQLPYRGLLRARAAARTATADHVISTNELVPARSRSTRGGKTADEVTVVRTGPDPDRLRRGRGRPRTAPRAASTWSPTSASWARRTASTSRCGPPTSWCTSSAAPTSRSR